MNPDSPLTPGSRRSFVKKSLAASLIAAQPTLFSGLVRAAGGEGTTDTTYDTTYGPGDSTWEPDSTWGPDSTWPPDTTGIPDTTEVPETTNIFTSWFKCKHNCNNTPVHTGYGMSPNPANATGMVYYKVYTCTCTHKKKHTMGLFSGPTQTTPFTSGLGLVSHHGYPSVLPAHTTSHGPCGH